MTGALLSIQDPSNMPKTSNEQGQPKNIRVGSVIDLTDKLPPPPEHVESIELKEAELKAKLPFSEIALPEPLRKAVDDLGFTHCTPIQAASLKATLDGRDLMGQAQTGTGKTATFLLTVIN
ncbi:MAG TPA: ATP-dependent RNA helicase RhlB, partial [Myxococcales bacterium]|nr:ATP-dependent RNA helicase RhlB [Myxococcales bacterium]